MTALKEWITLAEQGNADAQYSLGIIYDIGEGVAKDCKAAFEWYKKAAKQDNVNAQLNLGVMYINGRGVTQDYEAAAVWYEKAAILGDHLAQYYLGAIHLTGQGVKQDDIRAHMWWSVAAFQGSKKAIINRDILEKKMTLDDVTKARQLAHEFVAKNYKGC